jgi:hypothetical protein
MIISAPARPCNTEHLPTGTTDEMYILAVPRCPGPAATLTSLQYGVSTRAAVKNANINFCFAPRDGVMSPRRRVISRTTRSCGSRGQVLVLALIGLLVEAPAYWLGLGVLLLWNALVPRLNPFDAIYNAVVLKPRRLPPVGPARGATTFFRKDWPPHSCWESGLRCAPATSPRVGVHRVSVSRAVLARFRPLLPGLVPIPPRDRPASLRQSNAAMVARK